MKHLLIPYYIFKWNVVASKTLLQQVKTAYSFCAKLQKVAKVARTAKSHTKVARTAKSPLTKKFTPSFTVRGFTAFDVFKFQTAILFCKTFSLTANNPQMVPNRNKSARMPHHPTPPTTAKQPALNLLCMLVFPKKSTNF
jgi:hypothetical protein